MKVYVEDLLVKNCSCCDFCYTNSQGCVCKLTGHITRYDEPLEQMRSKCPLQSLADYTKQVRKEVCDKIREICKLNIRTYKIQSQDDCERYKEVDAFNKAIFGVLEVLDQIEQGKQND